MLAAGGRKGLDRRIRSTSKEQSMRQGTFREQRLRNVDRVMGLRRGGVLFAGGLVQPLI